MSATLPPDLRGPVQVALARAVKQIPHPGALPGGCRYELKWDGFRAVLICDTSGTRVWSRQGTDLTTRFPDVIAPAAAQLPPGTVLDGELVIWSPAGRLDFSALQTRMGRGPRSAAAHARTHPASYAAFDVLAHTGRDTRDLPFDKRRALLEQLAATWRPPMNLPPVTSSRDVTAEWVETYDAAGIEGLVVKGGADPYVPGKRTWLKFKSRTTVDVVCGAVIGPRAAPQEVVVGLPVDGVLRIVGRSVPLQPMARRALAPWLRPPTEEHPWSVRVPSTAMSRFRNTRSEVVDLTLVEPIVVEVSADVAWDASSSSFRHPVRFVRVRPDIDVSSVGLPHVTGWSAQ